MITHPSSPASGRSVRVPGSWPASNAGSAGRLQSPSALAGASAFLSSLSFLSDVPAVVGGAVLFGASKFGAAVAGTSKRVLSEPACFYFQQCATGSSTGSAMTFINQ